MNEQELRFYAADIGCEVTEASLAFRAGAAMLRYVESFEDWCVEERCLRGLEDEKAAAGVIRAHRNAYAAAGLWLDAISAMRKLHLGRYERAHKVAEGVRDYMRSQLDSLQED